MIGCCKYGVAKQLSTFKIRLSFSANCPAVVGPRWRLSVDCARNPEKCTVKHPIREFIYIAPDGKIQSVMVDRSFNSTNNKPYREHYLGVLNKTVPDPEVNSTERYLRNGKTNDYYRATTLLKIEKNCIPFGCFCNMNSSEIKIILKTFLHGWRSKRLRITITLTKNKNKNV